MDVKTLVGEDEVIKMNAEMASKNDFTLTYIENLPENIRAELIDGQIFYLAAPQLIHQELIGDLYFQIRSYIEAQAGNCKIYVAPVSVRLSEDDKNYLEPDIIVICDSTKLKEDGCHGAPDLIIEVASKSTQKRDYGLKMAKYRSAGVKEYWVIDPQRQTIMVYWFENETMNELHGIHDEVEFHLFPGLKVTLADKPEHVI